MSSVDGILPNPRAKFSDDTIIVVTEVSTRRFFGKGGLIAKKVGGRIRWRGLSEGDEVKTFSMHDHHLLIAIQPEGTNKCPHRIDAFDSEEQALAVFMELVSEYTEGRIKEAELRLAEQEKLKKL